MGNMMKAQVVTKPLTAIAVTKIFVLAHPIGMAVAGSVLLDFGA